MLKAHRSATATGKFVVVRNGIPDLQKDTPPSPHGDLRIAYLGNFYARRNPLPFLDALASRKREEHNARSLFVDFVGNCDSFGGVSIPDYCRRLGIEEQVSFHGWVSHGQGQSYLDRADILLLLAPEQPVQVPNKLYEYLGTRKPILAVVDANGETAEMLRAVGGHCIVTDNTRMAMLEALSFLTSEMRDSVVDEISDGLLESWTTSAQMDALLAEVAHCLEESR
jgi:glycosyltransferase involved in cell wall biosynthesis